MPYFYYRAIDTHQQLQSGRLFAANSPLAEKALNTQHWVVLSLRTDWLATGARFWRIGGRSDHGKDPAFLDWCSQLQALLAAGIGLEDALNDLRTDGPIRFRSASQAVLNGVRHGQNLAQALTSASALPGVTFETRWIKLIAAGENAGHLIDTLAQLADHLAWDLKQSQHTRNQLLQPLMSGVCVLAATFFLILHLAPQVRPMFNEQTLSLSSKTLFWFSDTCREFGLALAITSLLLASVGLAVYRHHPGIRCWLQTWGLRTPILGQLPLLHDLGLYARTLALLQGNGIPILEAMTLSRETLNESVITTALSEAQNHVETGLSLHAAFLAAESGLNPVGWPKPMLRLIHQGERIGNVAQALKHISEHLQQRRRALIQQQQALLQPLVTVLTGALLTWVALALLGPFYQQLGRAW